MIMLRVILGHQFFMSGYDLDATNRVFELEKSLFF
jgi:hypothetical protein